MGFTYIPTRSKVRLRPEGVGTLAGKRNGMADYSFDFYFPSRVDVGADDIRVKELPTIQFGTMTVNTALTAIPKIESSVAVTAMPKIVTESTVSLGMENIRIKELPKIEFEVGVKPTRVHLPTHYKLCGSLFGTEIFSLSLCGESMLITEPYTEHRSERCQ
jgi:hypothetical protein